MNYSFIIQLEKNNDYIIFYDGISEKSKVIYNLTGEINETYILSSKRNMFIIYYRKNDNIDKGFEAKIMFGNKCK